MLQSHIFSKSVMRSFFLLLFFSDISVRVLHRMESLILFDSSQIYQFKIGSCKHFFPSSSHTNFVYRLLTKQELMSLGRLWGCAAFWVESYCALLPLKAAAFNEKLSKKKTLKITAIWKASNHYHRFGLAPCG